MINVAKFNEELYAAFPGAVPGPGKTRELPWLVFNEDGVDASHCDAADRAIVDQLVANHDPAGLSRREMRRQALDAELVDTFLDKLRSATPDEIRTWVQANVTDLPSAQNAIARLAVAVAYALNGGSAK